MLIASLHDHPTYEALSYTWGSTTPTNTILIDSSEFRVTPNLESALYKIRRDSEPVIIWIDAVCIAQNDADEKSWQVGQMGDVYRQPTQVLVWLGPSSDDSDSAMDTIALIGPYAAKVLVTHDEDLEIIAPKCLESRGSKLDDLNEYSPERLYQRLLGVGDQNWQFPLVAMAALIRRPWWRRTWVLQELILAKQITFLCGDKEVKEDHWMGAWFALALLERTIYLKLYVTMEDVSDYELRYPKAMLDNSARNMLRYRRWINPLYKESLSLPLLGLLRLTAIGPTGRKEPNFAVTDPRDRIYGMLGLATDVDILGIKPDYNADCPRLYTLAVISLLKQGHINVLDLIQFPKMVKGLPSWVPDWSCPIDEPLQLHEGKWYTGEGEVFKASGTSTMSFDIQEVSPSQTMLLIVGTRLDVIKRVGATWNQQWPDESDGGESNGLMRKGMSWLEKIYHLCRKRRGIVRLFNRDISGPPYGTEEQWRSAMIRASTGGQIMDPSEAKPRMMTKAESTELAKTINSLVPPDIDPMAMQFIVGVSDRAYNRKPFVTARGLLGLGPSDAQQGDVVAIFNGAGVPHILQPGGKGGFRLLGDAYVEGIMEGEFMTENPKLESFKIF
jgi:hypothetical protein